MKTKVAILAMLAMVALVSLARAEMKPQVKTLYIEGYDYGKFAIVGVVKNSFDEAVGTIKKDQPPMTELHANLWGSADQTGLSANNDPLSRDRSEEAKKRLEIDFPKAKKDNIVAVALGDSENIKRVKVDYWFTTLPPPSAPAKSVTITPAASTDFLSKQWVDKNIICVLAAAILISVMTVAILILMGVLKGARKRAAAVETLPPIVKRLDPVEALWEGKKVSVPLTLRGDGNVWTPFRNPENKCWVFRKDRELAKKAVKSFFKDAEGDEMRKPDELRLQQIRSLVSDGTIKEVVAA